MTRDEAFVELTGLVGDVYLLHPFMLHSASQNLRRDIRIITNPPVALKKPFEYFRTDGRYSLCEQKTLKELQRPEGLPEWKIACPREKIVPERLKVSDLGDTSVGKPRLNALPDPAGDEGERNGASERYKTLRWVNSWVPLVGKGAEYDAG